MKQKKRYPLDQSPFYRLTQKSRLAKLLRLSSAELRQLTKAAPTLYSEWDTPKRNGGFRHIENPHRDLKRTQARIARLLGRITPPDFLFCPVKGRSYTDNAAYHRAQRVVYCLDIQSYFASSGIEGVKHFFGSVMGCSPDITWILTQLSTFNGHLPTGSPLSPILAFFAHWRMWHAVHQISSENQLRLSVYIDDVTLSGDRISGDAVWRVKQIIHSSGLRYHKEKRYIDHAAEVTGVIIVDGRLVAPHRAHRKRNTARKALAVATSYGDERLVEQAVGHLSGLEGHFRQIQSASTLRIKR